MDTHDEPDISSAESQNKEGNIVNEKTSKTVSELSPATAETSVEENHVRIIWIFHEINMSLIFFSWILFQWKQPHFELDASIAPPHQKQLNANGTSDTLDDSETSSLALQRTDDRIDGDMASDVVSEHSPATIEANTEQNSVRTQVISIRKILFKMWFFN